MKIIHTADWHLGKNIEGHSRLPEQEVFLNDFVLLCEREQADLILIAGDIYDSYNPPALAEQLFYDTLKRLSRKGACMTVLISGNHDNPERLMACAPLAREHGIVIAGTPNTVIPVGRYGLHEITDSGPGYFHGTIHGEKVDLLLLPFPSERRLGEIYLEETEEEAQKAQSYGARIGQLFSQLEKQFLPGSIHLLASHLFVMNSVEDGSERSIQLGGSYLVGGDVFPASADYIALGHVHKPQKVPGCPIARYSGSPIHYNQRELSFAKEVLSITVSAGNPCQITEIPLPVYKPIEIWRCDSVAEALLLCEEKKEENSWVYLEIKTEHYIQEEDIKTMRQTKADLLAITPILPKEESEQASLEEQKEVPFDIMVQNYYQKKFHAEMEEETLRLLLSIMEEDTIL